MALKRAIYAVLDRRAHLEDITPIGFNMIPCIMKNNIKPNCRPHIWAVEVPLLALGVPRQ